MRRLGIFCLAPFLISSTFAGAQKSVATTAASSAQTTAPAYDTAALPKNKKAAWEMLRAANGLHGKEIKPWTVTGHYKLYGPDRKVSVEGSLEIVWAAPDHWRNTFTEDGVSTTEWRMPEGTYVKMGKPDGLSYPRSMMQEVIKDPIESSEPPDKVPEFLEKQKLFSREMSCFSNSNMGVAAAGIQTPDRPVLYCAEPDRPILRIAEQGYANFLNNIGLFQGRFVARQIFVRGDESTLFQLDLDGLGLASDQQLQTLNPTKDALLTGWITLPTDSHEYDAAAKPLHRLTAPAPQYPPLMKDQRVQGAVRLEAVVGVDGSLTVAQVLHSPNPALTQSAEDAVRQWKYEPYLLQGKPVAVHIEIVIQYLLNH